MTILQAAKKYKIKKETLNMPSINNFEVMIMRSGRLKIYENDICFL